MTGIKNLKEVCVFLALSLSAQQKAAADGNIGVADVAHLMNPLLALPQALEGVTSVPAEVMDMDPAEAAELSEAIKGAVDLTNDGAEAVVEQIIGAALQLAAAALAVKNAKAPVVA